MLTMHRILRKSLVGVAFALIIGVPKPASSDWLEGVKEIKIGEKTYSVCPDEDLMKRGFPVRQVPDEKNAAIEYIEAINLYVKPPDELTDMYDYVLRNVWIDEANDLLPWLEQNAAAIKAVREGVKKEDCKFPLLGQPGVSLFDILLPHLSPMRNLGRLLAIQGKYLEHQNKYGEAFDTYLVLAKMGYHVSRDSILISGLVGIACDAIAVGAIENCILRDHLDTETLTHFLDNLDAVGRAAENYEISMSGERAFGLSGVDELFDHPSGFWAIFGEQDKARQSLQQLFAMATGKSLGLRAILKSDFRRYWNQMDKWNQLPEHIAFKPENMLDRKFIDELPPWSLGRMLLPALSRARISFVREKVVKVILSAQVALEIYRNRNRRYPDRLNQLKGILDDVPVDPFTNEPLKYKRTEEGYVLYSVGDDLVDDGGKDTRRSRYEPDIVARSPLPEPEPFKPRE